MKYTRIWERDITLAYVDIPYTFVYPQICQVIIPSRETDNNFQTMHDNFIKFHINLDHIEGECSVQEQ